MKNKKNNRKPLLCSIFIAFGLSILSFSTRLIALKQTDYANGWDGYYYVMQAFTFIERGEMRALDFSPVYLFIIGIAYIIKDYILALKVSSSLLAGVLTFVGFKCVHKITNDLSAATAVGAFLIFSPTLTFVSAQFPKNLLGVIFLLLFLVTLTARNHVTKGLTFILTFISHRLTAGLASVVLLIEVLRQKKIRGIIIIIGSVVVLGLMLLPGILHIADVQRLGGSISLIPSFAPISFIKIWNVENISILWFIEIAILYCLFIYFVCSTTKKFIKGENVPKIHIYICVVLLILAFPFFTFSSGSMGYRLYLIFNLIAILIIGLISVQYTQKVKTAFSVILVAGGLFSYKAYNPKVFDPPYDLYFSMISPIENTCYQHNAELIVAHQGLAQLLIIYTDINTTNWQPPAGIDKTKIWRVTVNLSRNDFAEYLQNEDLHYITVLSNDYHYHLIREDKWEKFYTMVKQHHDNDVLQRIEYWGNPVFEKPVYLTQGRSLFQKQGSEMQSTTISDEKIIKLTRFIKAYPEFLDTTYIPNKVVWKDGTHMTFDDGVVDKDFNTLLNSPDMEDQLSMEYPKGTYFPMPAFNHDPGRIRYEAFFKKMYGSTPEEVEAKLVPIIWLPSTEYRILYVTTINGINEKLQAISNELDSLPPELKKYVENPGGTYLWRKISGTDRLSMHSFGIAIDINVEYAHYWIWDLADPEAEYHYENLIPMEIVEIFEKYGFIWGGKWYHYDTMHFEYRPELLIE